MLNRFNIPVIMTFAAVNGAFAQATAPAAPGSSTAPVTGDSGSSWLWIIIALVIIAGLVWYFVRGRSRATSAGTTSASATSSGIPRDGPHVYDDKTRK